VRVLPLSLFHQFVHASAIPAGRLGEDARRRLFPTQAARLLFQCMRPNEVPLRRFVCFCGAAEQVVEQIETDLEGIAENGADVEQHIDPRTPEFFQRQKFVAPDFTLPVTFGTRADQRQHCTNALTFGLDRVERPQRECDHLRVRPIRRVLEVLLQQTLRHLLTAHQRSVRRKSPRIDAVNVASARQGGHTGAHRIGAGRGTDIPAVEGVDECIEFATRL
jgi:hypothetical protein